MANDSQSLCLSLLHADSEAEVIQILKDADYWDDASAWRDLGDKENNFSIVGNQQSKADAALVEKLVNAIDARLMAECLRSDIDPEGSDAPPNIRHAVAKFIERNDHPENETAGRVSNWTDAERRKLARDITLAATGGRRAPSFTIADRGEGQTPDMMPRTFLALTESNKVKIPFVQGKFHMGGTGGSCASVATITYSSSLRGAILAL